MVKLLEEVVPPPPGGFVLRMLELFFNISVCFFINSLVWSISQVFRVKTLSISFSVLASSILRTSSFSLIVAFSGMISSAGSGSGSGRGSTSFFSWAFVFFSGGNLTSVQRVKKQKKPVTDGGSGLLGRHNWLWGCLPLPDNCFLCFGVVGWVHFGKKFGSV